MLVSKFTLRKVTCHQSTHVGLGSWSVIALTHNQHVFKWGNPGHPSHPATNGLAHWLAVNGTTVACYFHLSLFLCPQILKTWYTSQDTRWTWRWFTYTTLGWCWDSASINWKPRWTPTRSWVISSMHGYITKLSRRGSQVGKYSLVLSNILESSKQKTLITFSRTKNNT